MSEKAASPMDDLSTGGTQEARLDAADPRFSTLPTATLKRLLWAAKGAACTCIQSAGMSVGPSGETATWMGPKWDCPRCAVIRDVCEAVPDVL